MKDMKIWHYCNVFEKHVWGVFSQYDRIKHNLEVRIQMPVGERLTQASLDIYYYTLTWDKLRKIHEKFRILMNEILRDATDIPSDFKKDFREWNRRLDHLFREFDLRARARDEYEHPSLEPYMEGSLMMWGNMVQDRDGSIKMHVGKNQFVLIRTEHIKRLDSLRIDLIDIVLKHFSQKRSTKELLQLKQDFEEGIDEIVSTYNEYRKENKTKEANELFVTCLQLSLHLQLESISLSPEVENKVYSMIFDGANEMGPA